MSSMDADEETDRELMDRKLSVRELADMFDVCPNTVHKWLKTGQIDGVRVGKQIKILMSEARRLWRGMQKAGK